MGEIEEQAVLVTEMGISVHELQIAPHDEASQGARFAVGQPQHCREDRAIRREFFAACENRAQIHASGARGDGRARQRQDRRHQIEVPRQASLRMGGRVAQQRGVRDHGGHLHHLVVGDVVVLRSRVFEECLAVIGGHDQQSVVPLAQLAQRVAQGGEHPVDPAKPLVVAAEHCGQIRLRVSRRRELGREIGVATAEQLGVHGRELVVESAERARLGGDLARCPPFAAPGVIRVVAFAQPSQLGVVRQAALGMLGAVSLEAAVGEVSRVGVDEEEVALVARLAQPVEQRGERVSHDVQPAELTVRLEAPVEAEARGHIATFVQGRRPVPHCGERLRQGLCARAELG